MRRALSALLAASHLVAQTHKVSDAEVMEVHRSALLIDGHNDVAMRVVDGFHIRTAAKDGDTDLARMLTGGIGAQFFAAYVAARYVKDGQSAERALNMIDAVRNGIAARYPDNFVMAGTADEILAAHKRGKIAALIGLEGGHAIEDSLDKLRQYYGLGVRYMTLTHSNTNHWADSSGDINKLAVKHHDGLTDFGRHVVREMNKLGMLVDISHVADKTFWDALEVSRAPLIASHSSCRAISGAPRNMTDEMIQALAKKGGVIMINFACDFISDAYRKAGAEGKAAVRAKFGDDIAGLRTATNRLNAKLPQPAVADVVAHIDHVKKIAGVDAAGIGSDFDGIDCAPKGLEDVSKYPNLTRALLEGGYTAAEIRKIYGENILRVMRAAEKVARSR